MDLDWNIQDRLRNNKKMTKMNQKKLDHNADIKARKKYNQIPNSQI